MRMQSVGSWQCQGVTCSYHQSVWRTDSSHLHPAYMWHELLMLKSCCAYHVAGTNQDMTLELHDLRGAAVSNESHVQDRLAVPLLPIKVATCRSKQKRTSCGAQTSEKRRSKSRQGV